MSSGSENGRALDKKQQERRRSREQWLVAIAKTTTHRLMNAAESLPELSSHDEETLLQLYESIYVMIRLKPISAENAELTRQVMYCYDSKLTDVLTLLSDSTTADGALKHYMQQSPQAQLISIGPTSSNYSQQRLVNRCCAP